MQVSVVIPIYNTEQYLCQCLDSVMGQTLRDIEIICVDDGSTDSSPRILAEYADQDNRFQIMSQENAGPGATRNLGLSVAKGEYLIFLDSDDWYEPVFLERMVCRAEATGADVTVCRSVEFDARTEQERPSEWMLKSKYLPGELFSPGNIAEHIFQFTYGWPWDKLYRADFVRRADLRYPTLPNSEDLVFVFQSLAAAGHIAVLPSVLVHHRVNRHDSVSNSRYKNPDAPYQALILLRKGLEKRGLYQHFERSFLNWAMEFLVWNVSHMGEPGVQRQYFDKLQKEYLPEIGFGSYPGKFYENRFTYCKYLLVRYASWPVFSGVLRAYQTIRSN